MLPDKDWHGIEFERTAIDCKLPNAFILRSGFYFYFLESGRLEVAAGGSCSTAGPGQLVFCPAWARRRLKPLTAICRLITVRMRYNAFAVEVQADAEALDILMALARRCERRGHVLSPSPGASAQIGKILQETLAEGMPNQPGVNLFKKAAALGLLGVLSRERWLSGLFPAGSSVTSAYRNIQNALLYIEEHYSEAIGIEEMARAACLSRSHFQAVFRQYTGLPPKTYLTRYRLGAACRLLATTEESIAMVAYTAGFGSMSQFYSAFTKTMRTTPAEFKKGRI